MKVYVVHEENHEGGRVFETFARREDAESYVERARLIHGDGLLPKPTWTYAYPTETATIVEMEVRERFSPLDFHPNFDVVVASGPMPEFLRNKNLPDLPGEDDGEV